MSDSLHKKVRTRDIDLASLPHSLHYLIDYYSGKTMPREELERVRSLQKDYSRELGIVHLILEEAYDRLTNDDEKMLLNRECIGHILSRIETTNDFINTLNDGIEHLKRMEHNDFVNNIEAEAYDHIYKNNKGSKFITLIDVTDLLIRRVYNTLKKKSGESRFLNKADLVIMTAMEQNNMEGLICTWDKCQNIIPRGTLAVSRRANHTRRYYHKECAQKLHIWVEKHDLRNL